MVEDIESKLTLEVENKKEDERLMLLPTPCFLKNKKMLHKDN